MGPKRSAMVQHLGAFLRIRKIKNRFQCQNLMLISERKIEEQALKPMFSQILNLFFWSISTFFPFPRLPECFQEWREQMPNLMSMHYSQLKNIRISIWWQLRHCLLELQATVVTIRAHHPPHSQGKAGEPSAEQEERGEILTLFLSLRKNM